MKGERVYMPSVYYYGQFKDQRMINVSFSEKPPKKILADRNKSHVQNLFPQMKQFRKQQLKNERFFNLNTKDIPGAQPGTRKPQILKNIEKKLHNDILQDFNGRFNQKKIGSCKRSKNYFYLNPEIKYQDIKSNIFREMKKCKQQLKYKHSCSQQTQTYQQSDEKQKISKQFNFQREFNQLKEFNHSNELGIIKKKNCNNFHLDSCQKEKLNNQQSKLKNESKIEDWKKVALQMRKMNPSFLSSFNNPFAQIQFLK